jgi:hypothetical protein
MKVKKLQYKELHNLNYSAYNSSSDVQIKEGVTGIAQEGISRCL